MFNQNNPVVIGLGLVWKQQKICKSGLGLPVRAVMDLFPNEQNFDLDKSRQKFHHNLKEHRKISNIPKFRCEML
jgi:hypothetical protein